MKEFDFDELDKAVNSVVAQNDQMSAPSAAESADNNYVRPMSTAPWTPPVVTPAAAITEPMPEVVESMVKSVESEVTSAPEIPASFAPRVASATSGPKPVINAGRRGGFMDIVTPTPTQPVRVPSRVAAPVLPVEPVALQPQSSVQASDDLVSTFQPQIDDKPIVSEPVAAWSTEPVSAAVATELPAGPVWPDPIDLDKTAPAELVPAMPAAEAIAEQDGFGFRSEATSPFLPDTKVEKRPLGAYSANTPDPSAPAAPVSFFTPLSAAAPAETVVPAVVPAAAPPADAYGVSSYAATPPAVESSAPVAVSSQTLSIPSQHKPESAQAGGLIFDTKEYHPPLLEAKSHSDHNGLGIKIAIGVLLVVFVSAVGYIVYKLVSL